MSQVVLGLRSLGIKLAIFFVMAALLAWALGGTLFPKPYVVNLIEGGVKDGNTRSYWRLILEDRKDARPVWEFVYFDGKDVTVVDDEAWTEVAGPILADAGVFYGGADANRNWFILRQDGSAKSSRHPMPDRLAVEQQLERLVHGLPIQDVSTILAERMAVLDPHLPNADGNGAHQPAGAE